LKILLLIVCLFTNVILYAQPGDTDGTPTDNLEGTDPAANIDSMLLFLGVFGVILGFYVVQYLGSNQRKVI
jgi:hypothetical protein